jgi:5'-methylthioadenosine phosphorylase
MPGGGRIGIIGGTNLVEHAEGLGLERLEVETPFGPPSSPLMVGSWEGKGITLLVRHGLERDRPPHRINHRANIKALSSAGVDRLVLVASGGSLRPDVTPPAIMVLDDFMSPFEVPTFFDDRITHITPVLSPALHQVLCETAKDEGIEVVCGGTYVQTRGPRLETKAEIRMMRDWGDVVGMTLASEATLAMEQGMEVAGICSVDNLAHGIAERSIKFDEIMKLAAENWKTIERLLRAALPRL